MGENMWCDVYLHELKKKFNFFKSLNIFSHFLFVAA